MYPVLDLRTTTNEPDRISQGLQLSASNLHLNLMFPTRLSIGSENMTWQPILGPLLR